jgi:hypothetical protein
MIYVGLYLFAVVAANLLITRFGVSAVYIVAFVLIGFDLTSRDKLHDAWHNNGLVWKMGLLISTGSFLSWLLNREAAQIAIASMVAFACAAIADTVVYHFLRNKSYMFKINGSNVISSLVDSFVFPTIAFGGFSLWVTLGQFFAKFLGGFFWSLVLKRFK